MADEFKITKAIMEQADTYIPIAMKEMIASDVARVCVKETAMVRPHGEEEEQGNEYAFAPTFCENPRSKARVMMTILLSVYLHIWGEDTPLLCDIESYDQWARAHVLNQLERFKAGEYRVIRERGRNMLVSPDYPNTGGMVVDWVDLAELEAASSEDAEEE
jgi:hypothetical protein